MPTAGGLIGALTEHGVSEEDARHYAEGVRRGDILITVHATGARADRAASILDDNGAININDRISAWRKRGWTAHDPNAMPLTADELERERNYYAAADKQAKEWSAAAGKPPPKRKRKIERRREFTSRPTGPPRRK